jgi:excisionase family DNA binding protein
MEDTLLKVEDVRKRLALSRAKVYRMIQQRELPAVKIGESVRVTKSDLNDFIERHRTCN